MKHSWFGGSWEDMRIKGNMERSWNRKRTLTKILGIQKGVCNSNTTLKLIS